MYRRREVHAPFLPESERRAIISAHPLRPFTENSITDYLQLEKELETIRAERVAYDREEHEPHVVCAAAPIFNYTGRVQAAISATAPTYRADEKRLQALGRLVRDCASTISELMGYSRTKG